MYRKYRILINSNFSRQSEKHNFRNASSCYSCAITHFKKQTLLAAQINYI